MLSIKELIEKMETERARILYTLCERTEVWEPNILLGLVSQARTITKTIKILKEQDESNSENT